MTLADLLEHTGEYLDDRGSSLLEGEPDELWSDAIIVRFLNEAERRLCRRSWVLIDSGHSLAGLLTLVTGQDVYTLHSSVLRVLDATLQDDTAYLSRANDQALRRPVYYNDAWWPDLDGVTAQTGRTRAYATDTATKKLRVYPIPRDAEAGLVVTLRVVRMPATPLDVESPDVTPEVPEEYHLWLADYAAGRCLTMPNVDSDAKVEGRRMLAEFEDHVKEARQDRQRANLGPERWGFSSATAYTAGYYGGA